MKASQWLTLILLWAAIFLGHIGEPGLKMDAMTYAALAKHILATGDWKVLHYTPAAYANFYQHPPLAMWVQALVFKLFGATDLTARLFPAFCGLATILGVALWGSLSGSAWIGFISAIVLLSTGRYVKFATDFFLDGPLAMFMVWGGLSFLFSLRAKKPARVAFWVLLSGFCSGAAFMTKGLAGLFLPAGLIAFALLDLVVTRKPRVLALALATLVPAVLVVLAWISFGGGLEYLRHYWAESVSGRLAVGGFWQKLDPSRALLRTYWPWLPFLIVAAASMIGSPALWFAEDPAEALAFVIALLFFASVSWNGFYLDHYLVPFYPFAALLAGKLVASLLARFERAVELFARGAAVTIAFVLAILPIRVHLPRGEPLRGLVEEAQSRCPGTRLYEVTGEAMERWMALAVVLWVTPAQASSVGTADISASAGTVLITKEGEKVGPAWREISSRSGLRAWVAEGSPACRQP